MKGMSPDELAALSPKSATGSSASEFYIDSSGERVSLHGQKALITRYEGKAGSIRRSAKGRTRRLPNGTRKFMVNQLGEHHMIAYVVKPV